MYTSVIMAVLIACTGLCAQSDATLSIRGGYKDVDENGAQLLTLSQHETYQMQLSFPGEPSNLELDGGSVFRMDFNGSSRMMHGSLYGHTQVTVTHDYSLEPRMTGRYTLGPARVTINGQEHTTNRIRISVVDPVTYDAKVGRAGKKQGHFSCRIELDKEDVVVGEEVVATFVLEDDGSALRRGLSAPRFGDLTLIKEHDDVSEQVVVNGRVVYRVSKSYRLIAEKPGIFSLGAEKAEFIVQQGGQGGIFGNDLFGFPFGGGRKKKHVVSVEPRSLTVHALPETAHDVDAIGTFSSFEAHIDKHEVTLNEPVTLKISLKGEGNFDAIVAPSVYVSDEMTLYDSGASFEKKGRVGTKTFEYVLQVDKEGKHIIPEQEFVFFDTKLREYKTLRTSRIVMQVGRGRGAVSQDTSPLAEQAVAKTKEEFASNKKAAGFFSRASYGFPWWIFVVLLIVFLVVGFRDELIFFMHSLRRKLGIVTPYKKDKAALKKLVEAGEIAQLHRFFITLLARWWRCDSRHIDADLINASSKKWLWSESQRNAFITYLELCSNVAFASDFVDEKEQKKIINKAEYWLDTVYLAKQGDLNA